jgi:cytoplasmic iron level regulating protein YaaA (DUF328/UPF0246 family)
VPGRLPGRCAPVHTLATMKIVLSPAKRLDEGAHPVDPVTEPRFLDDTEELVDLMEEVDVPGLRDLMSISEDLAILNVERFRSFDDAPAHPAMFLFSGDTYRGLDATSMDADTIAGAQDRVRILSGLYGILRPLDATRPYRLEMGTKLATDRGDTLYDFWGTRLGTSLAEELDDGEVVVNGASREYVTALQADRVGLPMVEVRFENLRNGNWRVYGMLAKVARGALARWIAEHDPDAVEDLYDFDALGYEVQPDRCDDRHLVFRSTE